GSCREPPCPAAFSRALRDALPIAERLAAGADDVEPRRQGAGLDADLDGRARRDGALEERPHAAAEHVEEVHPHGLRLADAERERSEEHTSELQSREKLVCRLPLEK